MLPLLPIPSVCLLSVVCCLFVCLFAVVCCLFVLDTVVGSFCSVWLHDFARDLIPIWTYIIARIVHHASRCFNGPPQLRRGEISDRAGVEQVMQGLRYVRWTDIRTHTHTQLCRHSSSLLFALRFGDCLLFICAVSDACLTDCLSVAQGTDSTLTLFTEGVSGVPGTCVCCS